MYIRKFLLDRGLSEDILDKMEDDKVNIWRLQLNKVFQNAMEL